ncbi:CesT family type III secretion system chaperone [Candidatus Similichlamydia laticola]|uniref:Uncharacterized protein n=1 Tax=Candidatus Similichlamydia laticola TaxID=2170265 RepID=A0A369KA39_9BACT|nr:CesT family type III secretion system chaperone [Candidatus Similichlamydia laticola]RDB31461.1 hypothetical protein HAT2_00434 [Candidatus Similichlamydia laticola]
MYYLSFEELIKELAERWIGFQIELNGKTSCVLRTESELDLFLEADSRRSLVYAICFLGEVTGVGGEGKPLLLRLLQENLHAQHSGVFGIDTENHRFSLHKTYRLENLSADHFSDDLARLHNKGLLWTEVIKGTKPLPAL